MPWNNLTELLSQLVDFAVGKILIIVPVVVVSLIAIKIIMKLVDRMLGRLPTDETIKTLVRTSIKILLLAVAAIVLMSCLEIPVTSFVALLSVAGLALSLSIQNFLSNVFAGLQLLASKPFKVGDYIETNSVSGTVKEIGMAHTKLVTVDNKLIYIPNSEIAGAKIINYNPEERRRVDLVFSASYDDPTERVIAAIRGAFGQPLWGFSLRTRRAFAPSAPGSSRLRPAKASEYGSWPGWPRSCRRGKQCRGQAGK